MKCFAESPCPFHIVDFHVLGPATILRGRRASGGLFLPVVFLGPDETDEIMPKSVETGAGRVAVERF